MNGDMALPGANAGLLEGLSGIVGEANVLADDESRTFYSTDVYRQADVLAAAVVRPGTVAELQAVGARLRAAHRAPLVVRGGGASYTDGYLPVREGTVCIDMSRLTRIDVNAEDMYVTVEPASPGRSSTRRWRDRICARRCGARFRASRRPWAAACRTTR